MMNIESIRKALFRFAVLILIAATGLSVEAQAETVQVFIFAGQSNMSGSYAKDVSDNPQLKIQPTVWFDDYNLAKPVIQNDWGVLAPLPGPRIGPEISFGQVYTKAHPLPDTRLAIMKVSRGGTGSVYWAPTAPREKANFAKAGGFYHLMDRIDVIKARLDAQVSAGEIDRYQWAGLIWMQGEQDAHGNTFKRKYITNFIANTTKLFSEVRRKVGVPELPIILGRLSSELDAAVTIPKKLEAIRSAQVEIAQSDPLIAWIDTDDLPLQKVGSFHFNGQGYLGMGERFAEKFLGLRENQ